MFITVKQASEMFGISEARVRQLLRSGRMSGHRAGPREWKVSVPWNVRPGQRGPDFGGNRRTREAVAKARQEAAEQAAKVVQLPGKPHPEGNAP